jgi:periplasmic divalent cation tolerance protein
VVRGAPRDGRWSKAPVPDRWSLEVKVSEVEYCVVFITVESEEQGRTIAERLLEQKLCACVTLVPGVDSRFWWKGRIDRASESLLVVKTKRAVLEALGQAVRSAHSYEVPEIIALPIVWGSPSYLEWIDREVSADVSAPVRGAEP